jgi:hypothetical protein
MSSEITAAQSSVMGFFRNIPLLLPTEMKSEAHHPASLAS